MASSRAQAVFQLCRVSGPARLALSELLFTYLELRFSLFGCYSFSPDQVAIALFVLPLFLPFIVVWYNHNFLYRY